MADPVDPVQPPEGQGGDGQGASPYQEWLDRIPEEVRGDVEPVFRDWDAQTTRKFQEAAQQRESWKPYEELGVNQRQPEEVQWAMQMLDAVQNNPQAVAEWYQTYAPEHGLTPAQAAAEPGDEGYVDPSQTQWLEQQLGTHLGPMAQQLQELAQWRDAQEEQRREAEVRSEINSEMASLKSKHPDEFSEPMVEKLIANYMNEADPRQAVQKAFADWQSIRNQLTTEALQGKVDTPSGAESGGAAAQGNDPARTFKEAKEQALAMLRADNNM